MIFDIQPCASNAIALVEHPRKAYQAWDLLELLQDCFPSQQMQIGCWSGYENCLVLIQAEKQEKQEKQNAR